MIHCHNDLIVPAMTGFMNIWALGSSTSQSTSCVPFPPFIARARLVATRVLPVPPLPLAMEIITLFSHHLCATVGAAQVVTRHRRLVRDFCPTTRADAIAAGAGSGATTSHSAPASAASANTSSRTSATPSGWSGSVSSGHIYTSSRNFSRVFTISFPVPQCAVASPITAAPAFATGFSGHSVPGPG